jgi:hypothetical protein
MQIETLAIVRPPTTGDQELASRLLKAFTDASQSIAVYSPAELCSLDPGDLHSMALLLESPGQCIEASGDEPTFLSRVASAHKRILASVGPVDGPWYRGRLSKEIPFDAVLDLGFASQGDRHSEVSDVPYHFVFNGLTREEEPLAAEPASQAERTIPWVLVGPKNDRNRGLLAELFEQHSVDPGGFCLLHARLKNMAKPAPMLGGPQLSAVLSKARYYLWGGDRDVPYYESFRFIGPLLAGTVPCKIDADLAAEGPDIPGVYASVSAFEAEVRDIGYLAMYRRARDFYASQGRLAEHLSEALHLV